MVTKESIFRGIICYIEIVIVLFELVKVWFVEVQTQLLYMLNTIEIRNAFFHLPYVLASTTGVVQVRGKLFSFDNIVLF